MKKAPNPTPVPGDDFLFKGKYYRSMKWAKYYPPKSRWAWLDLEPSEVAAVCVIGMAVCAVIAFIWSLL